MSSVTTQIHTPKCMVFYMTCRVGISPTSMIRRLEVMEPSLLVIWAMTLSANSMKPMVTRMVSFMIRKDVHLPPLTRLAPFLAPMEVHIFAAPGAVKLLDTISMPRASNMVSSTMRKGQELIMAFSVILMQPAPEPQETRGLQFKIFP